MLSSLVSLSLRHRTLVLVIAAALCVLGAMSARTLPIDVLPDLTRPTVTVLTEAPGLAPEEVELRITAPLEAAVTGGVGVERVRSVSGIGLSVIHVEFGWNEDVFRARQVVQERIAHARERLPSDVDPQMGPIASIMGEIMLLGISSPDGSVTPMDQRDAADWLVRPALLSIPGIAQVTVQGGEVRQFHVRLDPDRLRLFGLTIADAERALADANPASSGGFLISPSGELVVRGDGRARSLDDIASALIATRDATVAGVPRAVPVRLRDVAQVVEAPQLGKRGEASIAARPAVILAVSKSPGADTRALTRAIDERIAQLRPSLSGGLAIDADLFRQSRFIDTAVGNVEEALALGALFVLLVLASFLVSVRATLISLVALPISILATFIVFRLLGQSINTMTLGGIAIATGELVDDAVVGVENIHRRLRVGFADGARGDVPATVFRATCEVRAPILVSTLVVLLVFVPLLFLPDLAGRLFTPLAHAYIVAIAVSMLVSLTVTPALAAMLLRAGPSGRGDGPVLRWSKALAARAYAVSMPRPRIVVVLCAVLVLFAAAAVPFIGAEFLPRFNEGTAVVSVTAAPGISLEDSNRLGAAAEQLLLTIPEVKQVARRTGRAEGDEHALGVHASEIEVTFQEPGASSAPKRAPDRIFADIRDKLADLPAVNISVGQPIAHRIEHLESGVEAQIVVKVFGPDLSQLRALAARARTLMASIPGITDLAVEQQVLAPQVRVRIDADRAAGYGFSPAQVTEALQVAVGGKVVSQVMNGRRSIDVVLTLGDVRRDRTADAAIQSLGETTLTSPSGAIALISDLAEVRRELAPTEIARDGGLRRVVVSCNVAGGHDLGAAVRSIQRSLGNDLRAPTGYSVRIEGQVEGRRRAMIAMTLLGAMSLLVMFTLLWTHFRSIALALQVMLNIPFAFIGAVAALLIAGEPFSIASLIGFISLCGIAARNGVLMISHYQRESGESAPSPETIVQASQERVAPVLMTALTTGLALIPILLSPNSPGREILYPLALTICGGLATCTLLDFLVTPSLYLAFVGSRRHP